MNKIQKELMPVLLDSQDLCTIVGVKPDGTEVILGQGPLPPASKAREILRNYGFENFNCEDSEASFAMAAIEDLIVWMIKVGWKPPPLVTIAAETNDISAIDADLAR